MPIARIQMPDGRIGRYEVPEGTTPEQAMRLIAQPAQAPSQTFDPTEGMTGTQKFLAGAGKAFVNLGQGAKQLIGMGPSPEEVANQRQLDAPLMKTGAGMVGNLTGNIAATLPAMAIPGVNTYAGAAALGAGMGALQPVASGNERLLNTGLGAASGLAGQGLGSMLSKPIQPVKNVLSPEQSRLAQVATNEGIPLSAAQATGSKPLQIINSVLENVPFTSGPEAERQAVQRGAFNRAVLSRAGVSSDVATPDVLAAGKSQIGGNLGDIAQRNTLDFNQGLGDKLSSIVENANQHLPPNSANKISAVVKQIRGNMPAGTAAVPEQTVPSSVLQASGRPFETTIPGTPEIPGGPMSGTNYQGWRQPLNAMAKQGDETSYYFGQIKQAMDGAFRDQLPGAEGDAFRKLSGQYANLKTIANAMSGNSPSVLSGNIPPAQLGQALSQSIGREGKALGRGDLNDLVRAGNQFVKPQIPDSGTAQRMFYTKLLMGDIPGAMLGGGAGYAYTGDTGGALTGAGLGMTGSMGLPRLVQSALNAGPVRNYLINQSTNPNALALANALRLGGRSLGAALPMTLQNQ